MEIHIRKPKRSISVLLPLTFLVGALVGFALCYAIYAPAPTPAEDGSQLAGTPGATPAPAESTPGESPAPVETRPAAETAPESEPDAMEFIEENQAVWPARHLFIAVKGSQLDRQSRELLNELKPGGIVLTKDNIDNRQQTIRLVSAIKEAVGFGTGVADLPLVAVDQEGGPVNRLRLTNTTGARELGQDRDLEAARETGEDFATSALQRGIGVLLAPVLDVAEAETNRNLALRTFGDDNKVVTALGLAFAAGAMDGKVLPVVKHFPGHGAVSQDTHNTLAVMDREAKDLPGVFFPFSEAARAGIPGIMAGHIAVPNLDTDHPERPASMSPKLIEELIRERWAYDGVVISDDLSMNAIADTMTLEEAAVGALAAGCDAIIMLDPGPDRIRAVCKAIETAANDGTLPRDALARSKERLDQWQIWLRNPVPLKGEIPTLPDTQVAEAAETETETPADPAVEPEADPPMVEGETIYVVQSGDVLTTIARKFDVTVAEIQEWNDKSNTRLNIGDELVIRTPVPAEETTPAPEEATAEDETEPAAEEAPAEEPGEPETAAETPEAPVEEEETPAEAMPAEAGEPAPAEEEDSAPAEAEAGGPPPAMKKVTHTIAPGEFPGKIAQTYSVDVDDLFRWNGIADGRIRAGDSLVVYVPLDAPFEGEPVTAENAGVEARQDEPDQEPEAPAEEAEVVQPPDTEVYVVAAGDSLFKIATQFNTTRQELVELNKLENPNRLYAGQKIFVPQQSE